MITTIFSIICIISCIFAVITGNMENMGMAVIDGTQDAVDIIIVMTGVITLWNGLMRVLESSGILKYITKIFYPFLRLIYPDAAKKKNGLDEIALSMTANFFGLGNAATAISLSAMKKLKDNSREKKKVTHDMISFTVLNTCAVNFVPTTLIALRYSNNSADPFEVMVPIWICSVCCYMFAILILKIFEMFSKG